MALYDREGKRLLVLDPIGSGVWLLADGAHTIEQIVDEILDVFPVSRETVSADVERFIASLAQDSLMDIE